MLSILTVISKRLILSCLAVICLLFFTGFLFLIINSVFAGIIQLFSALLLIILLSVLNKNDLLKLCSGNLLKTRKFWAGIVILIAIAVLISLFSYYYIKILPESNFLIFDEKSLYTEVSSIFVTIKSVFIDYFLAFIYVIFIIITAIGGVSLLIKSKTDLKNGGKND